MRYWKYWFFKIIIVILASLIHQKCKLQWVFYRYFIYCIFLTNCFIYKFGWSKSSSVTKFNKRLRRSYLKIQIRVLCAICWSVRIDKFPFCFTSNTVINTLVDSVFDKINNQNCTNDNCRKKTTHTTCMFWGFCSNGCNRP